MTMTQFPPVLVTALVALRILVGWHFLYEGVSKLFNPNWTSAGYLVDSTWLFSDFFRWIVAHPAALRTADLLNIWGLTLIGVALLLGIMSRTVSLLGAGLLALYYVAQPPLIGLDSTGASEGSYLIVNKNLIELGVLLLFASLPTGSLPSLDQLVLRWRRQTMSEAPAGRTVPPEENVTASPSIPLLQRRELIKSLAAVPFLGVFIVELLRKRSYEEQRLKTFQGVDAVTSASMRAVRFARLGDLEGKVPAGKIGNLEISRVIVGGNLISGFAHSRDLIYVSPFLRTYFTDEKVIETLRLCEACGINTAILRTDPNTVRILNQYRKRGGRIQWLAQVYPKAEDMTGNTRMAIDNGAIGAFVQGGIADKWVQEGKVDLLGRAIEYIRSNGLIAGTAGHSLLVPMECERAGLDFEFYMKTFHNDNYWSAHPTSNRGEFDVDGENQASHDRFHDNMWCINPSETVEFMKNVKKAWIAYKVLAAGAIHPKDGFRYAFQNGADFACVGMFDFQVVENANIAYKLLSGDLDRVRTWIA
jgi:uncharacterized membrane protein YphA (DoxX/SURF4 family)